MQLINEDSQLYKGIFWIKDVDDIAQSILYFQIPVDASGTIEMDALDRLRLNSKNNDNYNHKLVWADLTSKETGGKPFDYYPRGRVEISNGKAIIYANPNVCSAELVYCLKKFFNLTSHNGINSVRLIPDFSDHYKCYLDEN